jgi:hypothetical protein
MNVPIIFLDFDGVLNSNFWIWTHADSEFGSHIDPGLVGRVNVIIARTGAKVVVSSAWRKLYTDDELRAGLASCGFAGEILGSTDHLGPFRGDEIQRWLSSNLHEGPFVILDDSADMAHLLPSLVRTDPAYGLSFADVERAVAMLEGRV